ncbi:STAS domain-containing protein [Mesoterricola silvestris]|uniref:STAS domain-containing protein n=1 Tax=Mesoterricola silvestris TaxID=2927979 RepID=A0AA48GTN1_9BACT|nr:hypothetical protein [Mesoterricola silvestris]BDU74145.1 hypothetical protein METEAL_33190 [Mesoterricola silvestris]
MLRIHIETDAARVTLRLEGKLIDPWSAELFRVWMDLPRLPKAGGAVTIDLAAVSFVDAQGLATLGALQRLGCVLQGSGPFVTALLQELPHVPQG